MCGHLHRRSESNLQTGDPLAAARSQTRAQSAPGDPTVRTSDAEREATALLLRDHAGEGRLELEELSERLDRAYAARTRGELDALLTDLPASHPNRSAAPSPPRERRTGRPAGRDREELVSHVASYVGVCLLLVAIWLVSGADYFWPIWPILGWGIGIVSHAAGVLTGSGGCAGRSTARLSQRAGSTA